MNHASDQPNRTDPIRLPTTSALGEDGELIELVYDPRERTTALIVFKDGVWAREPKVPLSSGDLVPFSPTNNLIKNEAVVLPSEPLEYGSEGQLLHDIETFIHCYVDLSPTFEKIVSHYVLLTWVYDAFNELPYLRLRGDYGTGKTRALLAVGSLCNKGFFASGASTVSPIFHTLDAFRGTLIFDEADFRFSDEKAEIVKILNNGNVAGFPVLRTVVTNKHEFNPRAFHVFSPKIIATRGSYDDRALESRFITEEMGQHRMRSDIPINLPPEYKDEARVLRNKLLLYRFHHRHATKLDPSLADPALEPRMNQILVPLLSIVSDPLIRDELRSVAGRHQANLRAERGFSLEAHVLEVIRELLAESADTAIPISTITARLIELHGADYERPMTNRYVGSILRRKLRLSPYKRHGVYVLPRSEEGKLQLLYDRYGIGDEQSTDGDAIGVRVGG